MYFKGEVEAELRENYAAKKKFHCISDFEEFMKEVEDNRGLYPHKPQAVCTDKG